MKLRDAITVMELIETLEKYPPEMPVTVDILTPVRGGYHGERARFLLYDLQPTPDGPPGRIVFGVGVGLQDI